MAQPESIAARGRQLTRNYLAQPLGAAYADSTGRLAIYFLLAGLFFIEVFLALAVSQGPSILISHMAFCTVYALHTALAFTLCHTGVDVLVNRLSPGWGGYGQRTVGRQWLIWIGGFLVGLALHRTVVFCLVHAYAPDVVAHFTANPDASPSHLSVIMYALPYWLAGVFLTIQVMLRKQRASRVRGGDRAAEVPTISETPARERSMGGTLKVSVDHTRLVIPFEKITHITVEDHYSRIHYLGAQGRRNVLIRSPLRELIKRLPADRFVQIHRSHVVNVRYVSRLTRDGRAHKIVLDQGQVALPVSRYRLSHVRPIIFRGDYLDHTSRPGPASGAD